MPDMENFSCAITEDTIGLLAFGCFFASSRPHETDGAQWARPCRRLCAQRQGRCRYNVLTISMMRPSYAEYARDPTASGKR